MIEPIGENILVKPVPVEEITSGGIYLPDSSRAVPDKGVIISVGDSIEENKLHEGVTIFFRQNSGTSIKDEGEEYIILPVKEVVGILKEALN